MAFNLPNSGSHQQKGIPVQSMYFPFLLADWLTFINQLGLRSSSLYCQESDQYRNLFNPIESLTHIAQ